MPLLRPDFEAAEGPELVLMMHSVTSAYTQERGACLPETWKLRHRVWTEGSTARSPAAEAPPTEKADPQANEADPEAAEEPELRRSKRIRTRLECHGPVSSAGESVPLSGFRVLYNPIWKDNCPKPQP